MMRYNGPIDLSCPAADTLPADRVRLAAVAYLARFTDSSREHTESDLRCYLRWCADRGMDPLAARRPDLEQYIRWMQETCRFKPSTISRRFSWPPGSTEIGEQWDEENGRELIFEVAVPASPR